MAAGGPEGIAGGNDARADDLAFIDRLLEADIVPRIGADIADGGEAGVQRRPGVGDGEDAPEAVGELQPV
jgi:hypothetical protein